MRRSSFLSFCFEGFEIVFRNFNLVLFTVVEQISDSASLYGKSIQGNDVCLLVKQNVGLSC